MKSALFVDFDNVYSSLRRLDPTAADRFASQPLAWMEWMAQSLELPAHTPAGTRRRVLVRRCYLNPQVYQRFRPAFNRAGFEIIDCPAMTSGGKTSTDIHMVLDIVDLLQHNVHYDEFIVFSADADFTPVLRKLRRWDRRTTVLAIGFPSAAYQACADLLIDQDEFMRAGLAYNESELASPVCVQVASAPPKAALMQSMTRFIMGTVAESSRPVPLPWLASRAPSEIAGLDASTWAGLGSFRKLIDALQLTPLIVDWESGMVLDPARHVPAQQIKAVMDEAEALAAIAGLVRAEATRTNAPVPCGRLAQLVIDQHGAIAADWCGKGSFRKLLEALPIAPLRVDWSNGGGHVISPQQARAAHDWSNDANLLPLLKQVHAATGMPLLPTRQLQAALDHVVDDIAEYPFTLTETGKRVRDRCRDAGQPISRASVSFLLKGILLGGHDFEQHVSDTRTLGTRFVDSILDLCQREQLALNDTQMTQLRTWAACGNMLTATDTVQP